LGRYIADFCVPALRLVVEVDGGYHARDAGLVALEPLRWPTSAEVARALGAAFEREGSPQRILTDRGNVFGAPPLQELLARHGVEHSRTKPHHPWTNGRIERLFRTFKETIRPCFWLVKPGQYAGICADFVEFYNDHRPHLAWGNRTPAEVHRGESRPRLRLATPTTFFEGRLTWWRFT
jgi:transposase InsO family protein